MKENKKKISREKKVLIGALSLAAVTMASSTFAWFTSKDEVTNRLTSNAEYNVRIVESFAPPANWLPGQIVNKDVYATNTGNIPAFVKEEISGVLAVTTEKATSTLTADSVKLTEEERYVMEAGAFLAYKPDGSTLKLGDQIVIRPDDQGYPNKTDFTPDVAGLYVFRRAIILENGTQTFNYEGYYFDGTSYYKISNLNCIEDNVADVMDDGIRTDGNLMSATAGFYEIKKDLVNLIDLRYEPAFAGQEADEANSIPALPAHPQRLVATYKTDVDSQTIALEEAAKRYDQAIHNYQYLLSLSTTAGTESSDANQNTKDAKDALDGARDQLDKDLENLNTAQNNLTNCEIAYNKAEREYNSAKKDYENSLTKLYGKIDGDEDSYSDGSLRDKVEKSKVNDNQEDEERFNSELKAYFQGNDITKLSVDQLKEFKAKLNPNDEKHDYFEKKADELIANRNYDAEKNAYDNIYEPNYEDKKEAFEHAETDLGPIDSSSGARKTYKEAYDTVYGENGTMKKYNDALKTYNDMLNISNGKGEYNSETTELLNAAKAELDVAKDAYDNAVKEAGNPVSDEITIFINLSDDVVTTATGGNDKWLLLPEELVGDTAVFYYTGILQGGKTSSRLVDSVELDKETENKYKSFDFDLNVKLDSVQITYDEDNETILTTGATDELKAKATLTDPKSLETAVTWTIS